MQVDKNCCDCDIISSLAHKIAAAIMSVDRRLVKPEFTKRYLEYIVKNRRLDPRRTNPDGKSPIAVCCALFGVWTAVDVLIKRNMIGCGDGQMRVSMFVNFSHDLLDWIL